MSVRSFLVFRSLLKKENIAFIREKSLLRYPYFMFSHIIVMYWSRSDRAEKKNFIKNPCRNILCSWTNPKTCISSCSKVFRWKQSTWSSTICSPPTKRYSNMEKNVTLSSNKWPTYSVEGLDKSHIVCIIGIFQEEDNTRRFLYFIHGAFELIHSKRKK